MAGAIAGRYSRSDREAFALLLTPFLILAAMIAMGIGLKLERTVRPMLAGEEQPVAARHRLPPLSVTPLRPAASAGDVLAEARVASSVAGSARVAVPEAVSPAPELETIARQGLDAASAVATAAHPETALPAAAPNPDRVAAVAPMDAIAPPAEGVGLSAATPGLVLPRVPPDRLAMLDHSTVPALGESSGRPPHISAWAKTDTVEDARCSAQTAATEHPQSVNGFNSAALDPAEFGRRLSAAAMRQLDHFTIYNDAYRRISYPMGDVAALYGVCTDVVIRAYRDLGVDLQVAVQKARIGTGDTNIDHRRTETLRRFFQRVGNSLPVSTFAEDYAPGDIVTYDRPQNAGSRSHIAVVTDVIGPTGAPMIVHNRGWGAQLEDALFVDRITGHYRYATGIDAPPPPAVVRAAHAAPVGRLQPTLRPAKSRRVDGGKPARQAERARSPRPSATDSASAVTQANMTGSAVGGTVRR